MPAGPSEMPVSSEPPPTPVPGTFLAMLDERERDALLALGRRRRFGARTVLIFEDDSDEQVLILLSGRVKVTQDSHGGREIILSIRDPGDILGELGFIDRRPRAATVSALEDVEAMAVAGRLFREHLESTPRVAVVLLETVARRFRDATARRSERVASDTMGRLAARMVELGERYGTPSDGVIAIDSPLSQDELAQWTGASRAGVAQALQAMRELGWIQTTRRRLTLVKPDALRARAS